MSVEDDHKINESKFSKKIKKKTKSNKYNFYSGKDDTASIEKKPCKLCILINK